ncbi:MAG: hypothetical protein HOJ35_07625 [Bdellovibrionales bacterium]|jgi:D-glycero-D-manno-heptose 1,7-bisphosphate phosphatase|nr:hypothetical protein [Bdellovibrionales bacterium]
MIDELDQLVDKVYFRPHHPSEAKGKCRKPETGMLEQAKIDFDINIPESISIGHIYSDLYARHKIGITKLHLFGNRQNHLRPYDFKRISSFNEVTLDNLKENT